MNYSQLNVSAETQKEISMKKRAIQEQTQVNIDRAMSLRLEGKSYREIAAEMSVAKGTAHKYVRKAVKLLQEKYSEKAEMIVVIEVNKLDKLEKALQKDARAGDIKASTTILKIMERRAKLLGLDSPARSEVKVDTVDVKIDLPKDLEIA